MPSPSVPSPRARPRSPQPSDQARIEPRLGRVVITGASGLVGYALRLQLVEAGASVQALVRRDPEGPEEIRWDPMGGSIDVAALEGVDAVVHLAGENIGAGRWTEARKAAIYSSRVQGTETLCRGLAKLERKPAVLLAASATGFYGDTGEREVDEDGPPGAGFLAEVCRGWEAATVVARAAGIRVVNARFGVVLSAEGGALQRMLPPFRLGLGGPIGGGRQWLAWIWLGDLVRAVDFALRDPHLDGPVNIVAPQPMRQGEFAKTLGHVLGRPALVPLPATAVRVLFGQMGEETLLAGSRVRPRRLEEAGFEWQHPDLEGALRAEV